MLYHWSLVVSVEGIRCIRVRNVSMPMEDKQPNTRWVRADIAQQVNKADLYAEAQCQEQSRADGESSENYEKCNGTYLRLRRNIQLKDFCSAGCFLLQQISVSTAQALGESSEYGETQIVQPTRQTPC